MKKHLLEQNKLWDYEVKRELGRGEYGTVFEVKSKKNGNTYALKKINIAGRHQKQKVQAFRQIKALKLIHHPDIIEYYQSFLSMESIYIVTQFAEKGDLSVEIKKRLKLQKKYTEEQLWGIIEELVMGLKYLHQKSIVHRDLKIENIFRTREGKHKIGDLGMSKIIYGAEDLLSTRVGTPIYFAPEVIQNRLYSFPVDIWALGCVFYTMAALQHPFKDATIQTLAYYIIDKDPKPIKGSYSPQLISFIMSMLDKNPQTRPTIHDLHKKIKERNELKITNKVSIFNLKQILSLKAQHLSEVSKSSFKKKNIQKQKDQEMSPILIHQNHLLRGSNQNNNHELPQLNEDQNPQGLKPEKRNMSFVLPRAYRSASKGKNQAAMIKSNGFSFYLGQGSPKKKIIPQNMNTTVRYGGKNNLHFSTDLVSPIPKELKIKQRQFFPRRVRARVQLI